MKIHSFRHSVVAASVIAALGMSTSAIAATSGTTTTTVDINNVATASYSVANIAQTPISSNTVTIRVSEQVSFSLVSNNADGSAGDDSNVNEEVAPNGFAVFQHTMTNTGNRSDSYTMLLENVTGDDGDYVLSDSTVTYSIYNSGQTPGTDAPVSTQTDIPVTTVNGQTITLESGQFVRFSISAKTNGNRGGNRQNLRLSATSTVLPAASRTLVNTDDSITRLPTFSIVKTFTNALDLNDANDTAAYRVVIKNVATTYSTAATAITIADNLPAGLIVAAPVGSGNVTATGAAVAGTVSSTSNGFSLTGASIPVGESITINFTVRKDPNTALATGALNHVNVTDDLDDNPNTNNTLVDSTRTANEVNVGNFYPTDDTDYTDGTVADGISGNDSTQPLLTINRQLTLTNPTVREIAPSGEVTHQTLITNNGQDAEGDIAGELTFTIADDDAGTADAVNIVPNSVTLTYDPDGTGPAPAQAAVSITPNGSGIYDINTALPNGIAPSGTVNISYGVQSNNAALGITEPTVVTLRPNNEGAPVVPAVTDETRVRGLTLVKSQALDATCDNVADTVFSSSATPLAALPDQCVIYRVTALNTSSTASGFNITDLVISDLVSNFSATADYRAGTATTTATSGTTITSQATVSGNPSAVTTTVSPLAPQGSATMQFAVKIKSDRAP